MSQVTVYLTNEVRQKLGLYTELAEGEVSGLGTVRMEENQITVEDVFLLEQENTSSSTDLSSDSVSDYLLEMIQDGRDPGAVKLWWHSHADMGVFWSGTDDDTIDRFSNEWMLSIVGNKKGQLLARLDIYAPIRVTVDKLDVAAYPRPSREVRDAVEKEMKEKIKSRTYKYTRGSKDGEYEQQTLSGDLFKRDRTMGEYEHPNFSPCEDDYYYEDVEALADDLSMSTEKLEEIIEQVELRRYNDGFLETD